MLRIKRSLTTLIFLALFSGATIVSCGTKSTTEEQQTEEHPEDSEHPSDTTEHPEGEHPAEHPADSTKK